MSKDTADLIFRIFSNLIFLALGGEHIFNDELLQKLMSSWMPMPGLMSIMVGIVLVA
tara:strand:- start:8482 stop:8652 length:171 start_codon:yes stop_codon:yes gene_type:complete